ncbi:MAG TPA: fructosamine kinase family protein, partial [Thermomicrobiales bacterium]|nr:fructosamine kinase family protein [Thermomicrobiales bacterium]
MYELPYNLNEEDDLPTRVMKAVGDRPIALDPLPGALVADVYRATFADGTEAVVKYDAEPEARLDIEAEMLRNLRTPDVIPVPDVYHASRHLLVQELIPGDHLHPEEHEDAGRLLAGLHAVTSPEAGLGGETLNGSILIPSPWTSSWIEFFREHRLGFATDLARDRSQLPAPYWERIQTLAMRLDQIIEEPDACSLLHGDVWDANVLSRGSRVAAFIDPSTCFGHPELELAYMSLFGGFGDADAPI